MYVGVARLTLDEVGTAVPACKAFADDLGGETKIGGALGAPQVRCMAIDDLAFWW
jgi:hypothetical protein